MIEIHLTEQQAGAILGINIERRGDIESKLTRWLADDNQNPWYESGRK